MVANYRVLWIRGRYGGGKKSLAFFIGGKLVAEGYADNLVSNIPCTFSSPVSALSRPCAVVLDEAWIYIEGRKDVYDYAGFVRKFGHYLLLPSVFSIHARLSSFTVQRVFNAYSVGIPLWWYRWNLRDKDVKESGYFGIHNPKAIFGHYPTKFVAGDDGGISNELAEISKRAGFKGTRREQVVSTVSISTGDGDGDIREAIEQMEDTGRDVADAVEDIQKLSLDASRSIRRMH